MSCRQKYGGDFTFSSLIGVSVSVELNKLGNNGSQGNGVQASPLPAKLPLLPPFTLRNTQPLPIFLVLVTVWAKQATFLRTPTPGPHSLPLPGPIIYYASQKVGCSFLSLDLDFSNTVAKTSDLQGAT